MTISKKARSIAAKKGWKTRRRNGNAPKKPNKSIKNLGDKSKSIEIAKRRSDGEFMKSIHSPKYWKAYQNRTRKARKNRSLN